MSTLQTQIDRARRLNYVDSSNYIDSVALEDANVIVHQIEDYITSAIGEGYFWDILKVSTTVIGQSEYTIPVISSGNFDGAPKLEGISIQYQTGGDFVKATEVNRDTLDFDLSYYETNQLQSDPIYFIADSSVFIYPAPTAAIANGIKFYGIKSLADITAATTYANIFGGKIPTKYFYMIAEGMGQYIKRAQGKEQEAIASKQQFELVTLPSLIEKLGNRKVGISKRGTPDVSIYR